MPVPLLAALLADVTVAEALRWKSLQVFPLSHPNGHAPACVLIDDLLDAHQAEITEVSNAGAVPTIMVLNHSALDALILDGTELRGARQNRMVNVTILAGHGAATLIPVSASRRAAGSSARARSRPPNGRWRAACAI